jgi:hypothetical protein
VNYTGTPEDEGLEEMYKNYKLSEKEKPLMRLKKPKLIG